VYAGLALSPSVSLQAWDLVSLCNGVLVGFVAITACAHVVEPWAAIINGAIGGLVSQSKMIRIVGLLGKPRVLQQPNVAGQHYSKEGLAAW
jgi:ammonia channel protein AmtB